MDYPTFYNYRSDDDDETSEKENFLRKKSQKNDFSNKRQNDITTDDKSIVIRFNEEKFKKATEYFGDIDVSDLKKYYTSKGECLLCGNLYFSAATAKRHIKLSHLKLREFKCPQCFLSFQEHKGVKEHLRRFHPEYEIVDLRTIKKEFRWIIIENERGAKYGKWHATLA